MTRAEHLEWSKTRALEYLDPAVNDTRGAFASMLSDLQKHPELENHLGLKLGVGFMLLPGWIDNPREVADWIRGFN